MNHHNTSSAAKLATEYIKQQVPNFTAKVGIVLGSGLGGFITQLENPVSISYNDLPGFPRITVQGHSGQLVLGSIAGVGVACLQGRSHSYEGSESFEKVKTYVRTLKLLGCDYFIATNASGSLRPEVGPGELMMITDHINLQVNNPLVGPNDDEFGPRFYPLDKAYDHHVQQQLLACAEQEGIPLHQGTYISVMGPNYETAAEIKAFQRWGADAVGMSTVPEVLVANHCGMKVGVVAVITNYATGLAANSHSHESVLETADRATHQLKNLIKCVIIALR